MKYKYNYLIKRLEDDEGVGYSAIIPKFPGMLVCADSIKELDEQVEVGIEIYLKQLKKDKKPVPKQDTSSSYKGKILLRISPELHEKLQIQAQAREMSLNQYIEKKLQ